jgi:predicted metal-dependent phosphotriesterase family hydrolase
LGLISPEELGWTLTHEHLPFAYDKFYIVPPEQIKTFLENKITLENVGFTRQYP